MDFYKVQWKHSAEQDLRNIDRQQIPRVVKSVETLAENPFPLQYRKLRGAKQLY